ncbi:stage II sporulation protein R [Anaerosporobacter sp.]|uniref:stage II sporulation protein R n=1 Tax=Anaerosporobacter sp. TaxID=1872529 RepID=UPI00286FACF3|nr:stage II sporulation protein R [Anaerosporobacter sp.]
MNKKQQKQKAVVKKYMIRILLCYVAFLIIDFSIHATSASEITKGISEKIIRLHVLANSDDKSDQALKLKVKDAVVERFGAVLASAKNREEAEELVQENLDNIHRVALDVIKAEGYNYGVNVYLTNCMFPTKVYKDLTFPAGMYEALRIDIGTAEGKNWWCVMYPPLCFVDQTYSIVPDDSKKQLEDLLTTREYESLFTDGSTKISYRFKIVEIIEDMFRIGD